METNKISTGQVCEATDKRIQGRRRFLKELCVVGHTYNPSVVCVSEAGKTPSLRPAWAIDSRTLTQQIKATNRNPQTLHTERSQAESQKGSLWPPTAFGET